MGSLIILMTFIIEIVFTAYCLVTKSGQEQVKSYLRVGALTAFILLALTAVIRWNFTWYLLAALLLVWAILGGMWLLRSKRGLPSRSEKKRFAAFPTLLRAIGTMLLVFVAVIPALIFPQHPQPPVTGKHPVTTALFSYTNQNQVETFTSTGEKRKVNLAFWYPADSTGGETYPLIVFTHGSMGMKSQNTSTFLDLASNGYVVCSIDSPYIALFTKGSDGRVVMQSPSIRQELYEINSHEVDDARELQIQKSWMDVQTTDINFVLDTILTMAQDSGSAPVYHLVDGKKIGLIGHSLGGESSALVARQRIASGKNDISAVVDLDADLSGEYVDVVNGRPVFNTNPYPVPILFILSDVFKSVMADTAHAADLIAMQHVVATAPHAYEIYMAGANHLSFTDLALSSPVLTSVLNGSFNATNGAGADPLSTITKMNATVLQFFNVYLKGEGSFSTAASQ